jgi:ERCC4-type nuclease
MIEDDFTVIIDTREQLPWEFGLHTTAKKKLDTGDYSIEGLEHLLCIERKKSVSEIANNISEKRFKDVLERMSKMTYPFMLFEFDLEDIYSFPVGSDIPKKLWDSLKISANYILKYITLIQLNYGVHILFCGGPENAEKMAVSIMKRVYEKHRGQQNTI